MEIDEKTQIWVRNQLSVRLELSVRWVPPLPEINLASADDNKEFKK